VIKNQKSTVIVMNNNEGLLFALSPIIFAIVVLIISRFYKKLINTFVRRYLGWKTTIFACVITMIGFLFVLSFKLNLLVHWIGIYFGFLMICFGLSLLGLILLSVDEHQLKKSDMMKQSNGTSPETTQRGQTQNLKKSDSN